MNTPDFGEPWATSRIDGIYAFDRDGHGCLNQIRTARAVACVNALAGIADPAAFVAAAKAVDDAFRNHRKFTPDPADHPEIMRLNALNSLHAALTKEPRP